MRRTRVSSISITPHKRCQSHQELCQRLRRIEGGHYNLPTLGFMRSLHSRQKRSSGLLGAAVSLPTGSMTASSMLKADWQWRPLQGCCAHCARVLATQNRPAVCCNASESLHMTFQCSLALFATQQTVTPTAAPLYWLADVRNRYWRSQSAADCTKKLMQDAKT